VDFKVIDSKDGPLSKDEIHRLTFKPLDPMDRYTKGKGFFAIVDPNVDDTMNRIQMESAALAAGSGLASHFT
jgi:hypothetical protein